MKSGREKEKDNISVHMQTLHSRLLQFLNLGTRHFDEKTNKWKWQCANIEVQKKVLRSMSAFLDFLSGDDAHAQGHSIVKESLDDVLGALLWILQFKNGSLLSMASNVAVKLVSVLPNQLLQSHMLDLVYCLASLLSSHQVEVAIPCATALNLVISNLSATNVKAVMKALEETETSICIVGNIKDFAESTKKIEYFEEMTSLLSMILWWWPPSRFPVCNDVKLMKGLANMHTRTDSSIKVALLKLYTSLALCDSVARKLLDDEEVFLQMVIQAMGESNPHVVRIEGFRLARCLLRSQENCEKVVGFCGDALVDAIICGMRKTGPSSKKVGNNHGSLFEEACQLALITRWAGDHHISFWKQGIASVLINHLVENIQENQDLTSELALSQNRLKANYDRRTNYLWDILGWLTLHCGENLNPQIHGSLVQINFLITCACLTFVDTLEKWCRIFLKDIVDHFQSEPVSRAVLMMIHSPCNHISSHARFVLSDTLKLKSLSFFIKLMHTLHYSSSLESYGTLDKLQMAVNLIGVACLASFPQFQSCMTESKGIKAIVLLVERCLSNEIHVERSSLAPYLYTTFHERSCCCIHKEDWEGSNILLFYGLLGLANVLHQCGLLPDNPLQFCTEVMNIEAQLVSKLHEICRNTSFSHGVRWYASYILSYFGFYGFPNEFSTRIGKYLNKEECSDMQLIVANGVSLSVHGVILAVRCPSLLPPQLLASGNSSEEVKDKFVKETMKEFRLSPHVDHEALVLLLEYVYLGCLQIGNETVEKLKFLAKRCNLQPLLQMLCRQCPKWGTPFPNFNLTSSLDSAGSCFLDVTLEAKSNELIGWTCNICSHTVPHLHAHKVILQSGSDYLQGLFRSGMQESHSRIIKVDISWEALIKLVQWFYSAELPNPPSGCLWDNMDDEEKLLNLQPYVEIVWLAEFWILENIQEPCWNVITSCLESSRKLSIKILKMAYNLSLWKLVYFIAKLMAPSYCQLRDSGELEEFDDVLVHLINSAYIQHNHQEGKDC